MLDQYKSMEYKKESGGIGGCPVQHSSKDSPKMVPTADQSGMKASEGCPVQHSSTSAATLSPTSSTSRSVFSKVLISDYSGAGNAAVDQVDEEQTMPVRTGDGCPVQHSNQVSIASERAEDGLNPLTMMPVPDSSVSKDQKVRLSNTRQASTIPMANFRPKHQLDGTETWTYPSEQQYYNAMKRKGWKPEERDIPWVLAIHNTVNEKGWREVLKWESFYSRDGSQPKLKRFMGRPKDLSPKARLLGLFGYSKPFDRHDWLIERDGEEVRYIIDFYTGAPEEGKPVSIHLDCRPALDSFGSVFDRVRMGFLETFGDFLPFGREAWMPQPNALSNQNSRDGERGQAQSANSSRASQKNAQTNAARSEAAGMSVSDGTQNLPVHSRVLSQEELEAKRA